MEMKRGDVVVCAAPGGYGKPRPAVVVQSDLFNGTHASVAVCLITSHLEDAPLFRIPVPSGRMTGLKRESQVMVNKVWRSPVTRLRGVPGRFPRACSKRSIRRCVCGWNWPDGHGGLKPCQFGRNLQRISPPHPLFQRAQFPPAVAAGIGTCGLVVPRCGIAPVSPSIVRASCPHRDCGGFAGDGLELLFKLD